MKAKFDKDSDEFKMFGDFYNILKEHYIVEDSIDYYNGVVKAVEDFRAKYGVEGNEDDIQPTKLREIAKRLGYLILDVTDLDGEGKFGKPRK